MPKRIPIKALRDLAKRLGLRQAVLSAWDGKRTHVVTYGRTIEDCDQAAQHGDKVRAQYGFPKPTAMPSRVAALQRKLGSYQAHFHEEVQMVAAAAKRVADEYAAACGPQDDMTDDFEPDYGPPLVTLENAVRDAMFGARAAAARLRERTDNKAGWPDIICALLNELYHADPAAAHALACNRVPCNDKVADHPAIVVDGTMEGFTSVGMLGVLNVLCAHSGKSVAAVFDNAVPLEGDVDGRKGKRARFRGFRVAGPGGALQRSPVRVVEGGE